MRKLIGLGLLAGVLAAAGCSSGGDDGGGASGAELGARYCALMKPCCQAAGLPETDQQTCKFLFSLPPADAAAGEACIAEYEQRAQAADWCDTFGTDPRPEACEIAYPESPNSGGTAKTGEACDFTSDCAAPAQGEATCYDDLCRVVVTASEGQACAGTRDGNITVYDGESTGLELGICKTADGLFCNAGTCAPQAQAGGTCSTASWYGCVDGTYCGSNTCKPLVPAGSSCAESSSACDDASYCDFISEICVARVPDGSACDTNEQCQSSFCDGGTCAPAGSVGNDLLLPLVCN